MNIMDIAMVKKYWGVIMTNDESKMLESVKYILQNIDISSFKAEFDLETKMVKVELQAEFEDYENGMKKLSIGSETQAKSDRVQEDSPEKQTQKNTADEIKQENNDASAPNEKLNGNQKKDAPTRSPSDITSKINKFLTSGISPSEKNANFDKRGNSKLKVKISQVNDKNA